MTLMPRDVAGRLGHETLQILRVRSYQANSGRVVDLGAGLDAAAQGTVEYPPERQLMCAPGRGPQPSITVENETVLSVGRRMSATGPVAALNFASATAPGGGFLTGARAQEESIARSSGLFHCLDGRQMYARHRAVLDAMYSDYVIYSPDVPVFRNDAGELLEESWPLSVLTSPAVHGKGLARYAPQRLSDVPSVMAGRTRKVLAVASEHGHRRLILGAWGCGAFGLDSAIMAGIFAEALKEFGGAFNEIAFAITDWSPEQRFIRPFHHVFGAAEQESRMPAEWFEDLMGFEELSYEETRANLEVVGSTLRSKVNKRSYTIGILETPSLAELRDRAASTVGSLAGILRVSNVVGDVGRLHRDPANRHALFQVASQFNLLEMTGPDVTPEHGVTRYAFDRTQGPACAIAAGAATVYRNYFAPVDGHVGQTQDRQIDCLRDLSAALRNEDNSLWAMRNGYALCTESGLASIARMLDAMSVAEQDSLRGRLRVGLHWDVEVTGGIAPGLLVSQVFCSALPVAYTRIPSSRWQVFATLVLEAAYESTLWATTLNTHRTASNVVYLTRVGGGAFGNDTAWIDGAIRRALKIVAGVGLDVRLVSHGQPDRELLRLVEEFR